MISGNHWPIEKEKLFDGYNLSFKNSKKILSTAEELLKKEKPDYALSIFLSASAIEEFGKGIMLIQHSMLGKVGCEKMNKTYSRKGLTNYF